MNLRLAVTALLIIHCSLAIANDKAVIIENYTVSTHGEQKPYTFLVGELVLVSQTRKDLSLIQSAERSWMTRGEVWLPTRTLVFRKSFKPVKSYIGEKHIEVGGGDFNAEYDFDASGGFKYHETGSTSVLHGHLYQFKNIIWAKVKASNAIDQLAIFKLAPDGHLDYPIY